MHGVFPDELKWPWKAKIWGLLWKYYGFCVLCLKNRPVCTRDKGIKNDIDINVVMSLPSLFRNLSCLFPDSRLVWEASFFTDMFYSLRNTSRVTVNAIFWKFRTLRTSVRLKQLPSLTHECAGDLLPLLHSCHEVIKISVPQVFGWGSRGSLSNCRIFTTGFAGIIEHSTRSLPHFNSNVKW